MRVVTFHDGNGWWRCRMAVVPVPGGYALRYEPPEPVVAGEAGTRPAPRIVPCAVCGVEMPGGHCPEAKCCGGCPKRRERVQAISAPTPS